MHTMQQDWEPVILRSSTKTTTKLGQTRPALSVAAQTARKAEDVSVTKPLTLTGKSRAEMAQVRVSKGWTQKQLDMQGQFPANSCNAWEAGKLCPTGPQLQKIHRLLGIKMERE
uniref:HTH cro/C1-type domain-containing protein n=1 Tax=viral metagenome TaxID=1070528 RepID=A0A6C0AP70_9ZZZZ